MEPKFQNDRHYEERVVQSLIVDHAWAEQAMEVLNLDYFNLEHLKETTRLLFEYYKKYGAFPSFKLLVSIVKEIQDETLKEKIVGYLAKISKEPLNGDMEYVKETSLDFCKRRALALALESSLDLIENKKYEQIIGTVQKALLAGSDRDVGHIYLDNFDKRMEAIKRNPVATPWRELNAVMGGGLSGGELGIIMGMTGAGKSHALVDIGCCASMLGLNVVHYTFELGDIYVGKRYDSRMSEVPFDNLCDRKEEVKKAMEKAKGHIVIKSFPARSVTTLGLKNHINQLTLRDKKPDVIIVDYVDILKSSKNYDQKRLEEEAACEELRTLAQELNLPVWTVTQGNREGMDVEVLTLKHVAECFGKAMIADFFLTMVRKKENTPKTVGNFFVAKSRLGPDGIKLNILATTGISKFEIVTEDQLPEGSDAKEFSAMDILKQRFKALQQEGKLS